MFCAWKRQRGCHTIRTEHSYHTNIFKERNPQKTVLIFWGFNYETANTTVNRVGKAVAFSGPRWALCSAWDNQSKQLKNLQSSCICQWRFYGHYGIGVSIASSLWSGKSPLALLMVKERVPVTLPYSPRVSKVTLILKTSSWSSISMLSGTRHEYLHTAPHPKGMMPEERTSPSDRRIATVGFNLS